VLQWFPNVLHLHLHAVSRARKSVRTALKVVRVQQKDVRTSRVVVFETAQLVRDRTE